MVSATSLSTFLVVSLTLLLTPGPAVAFVVARSLAGGRLSGMISQLGLCTGLLVHVIAASVGLSALVARSTLTFATLKYLGALYLVWLGIRALTASSGHGRNGPESEAQALPSQKRLFWDGVLIDVLNPKPALFFLALLPQFVDPAEAAPWRLAVLGLIFVVLAFVTGSAYALLAGTVASHLHRSSKLQRLTRWMSGSVYLTLGWLAACKRCGST